MIAFIDDHCEAHGVEPVCKVLPIAPSTYHAHVAKRRDSSRQSARTKRDEVLKAKVRRVFEENFRVYGVRKLWRQFRGLNGGWGTRLWDATSAYIPLWPFGRIDLKRLFGKRNWYYSCTLNRLEHAPVDGHRYREIAHDPKAIEALFVELFLDAHAKAPARITLDLDATEDPVHGHQAGSPSK